jgi:hypothetical protein
MPEITVQKNLKILMEEAQVVMYQSLEKLTIKSKTKIASKNNK